MKLNMLLLSTVLLTPFINSPIQAASSTTGDEAFTEPSLFDICQEMKSCILRLGTMAAHPKEGEVWGQKLSERLDFTMNKFLQAFNSPGIEGGAKVVALRDLVDVIRTFIEGTHSAPGRSDPPSLSTVFTNRLLKFIKENFTDHGIKLNLDRIERNWELKYSTYQTPEIQDALSELISANNALSSSH